MAHKINDINIEYRPWHGMTFPIFGNTIQDHMPEKQKKAFQKAVIRATKHLRKTK